MSYHETQSATEQIFRNAGALIANGHFVLSSKRHGRDYVNKDMVFADPDAVDDVADRICRHFANSNCDAVLGPAVGGAILAHVVAFKLETICWRNIHAVFADKVGDGFVVKRGYDALIRGKRVLVVEDVLTSGGSARKTVEAARAAGAEVVAVAALCNRGGVTAADLGDVPELFALMSLDLPSWSQEECPMCRAGIPINTSIGHG